MVDTLNDQLRKGGSIPTPTLQDCSVIAYPLFYTENNISPTSPLQFEIIEIPVERAKQLNLKWHSRLPKITNPHSGHTVCYGAIYQGVYYACAIWTDPIARAFNHKGYLELRRMAICEESPKNTASRMISIMTKMIKRKWPDIIKLISYQDTEVHKGKIYKASGWNPVQCSKDTWDRPKINRRRLDDQLVGIKIRWEKNI